VRDGVRDLGSRKRFFGLRRVEAISLDRAMWDQELQESEIHRAQAGNRVSLICAGDFVHGISECEIN